MSLLTQLRAGAVVARAVLSPFERPDRLPRALAAMAPWGRTTAGLVAGAAARYPDRVAIIDDGGAVTYAELWQRAQAIAASLQASGVGEGRCVGLLARNHRGFVEALVAVAATGADLVLLNTGFAGPQLVDVVVSEGVDVLIHDMEYGDVVEATDVEMAVDEDRLEEMAAAGQIAPRREQGSLVILTSGTTGRPKGAARAGDAAGIDAVAALVDRIPLRLGDTQVVAAPLFHSWGLSHLLLGLARCTTTVLARRFDAESTLQAAVDHDADVLVVVPVMLARMLDVPTPTPHLRVIASSGSAISSRLVLDVVDRFGPVLYNLYGSTEVAVATIATPPDLAEHPATAGRVASGVRVEILDADGEPVPNGQVGRIFVGGSMSFDGYTDGDTKEQRRGLMSSGDVGRFDGELLFVEGREDDMVVSGGENVFPIEVEDLLHHHPAIDDVVVVGIDDEEFGQALAAYVVRAGDAELSEEDVRAHVRAQLARHKVPRRVTFLDELPRNPTGKVLRRQVIADG